MPMTIMIGVVINSRRQNNDANAADHTSTDLSPREPLVF